MRLTDLALERLAYLRKDASQIGNNARKTIEFLDEFTEGRDDLSTHAVSLQGPTEQYQEWSEVENYILSQGQQVKQESAQCAAPDAPESEEAVTVAESDSKSADPRLNTTNDLSRMLLNKLNFANDSNITPPTSPGSSIDRSAKTSPEMAHSKQADCAPTVPHVLKSLVNAVIWRVNNPGPRTQSVMELYLLSNSADLTAMMRGFGISTKNIHQLRQAISLEDRELKNHSKYLRKYPSSPTRSFPTADTDLSGVLKYEEDSEEELVFQPRGRGTKNLGDGSSAGNMKAQGLLAEHRPKPSQRYNSRRFNGFVGRQPRPEIPRGEIDPNSFDRGGFGLTTASTPSAGSSNGLDSNRARGRPAHGHALSGGPPRSLQRGSMRGNERGSLRGRGRLFVP